MEHLLGCHGEWLIAAQALWGLPFVGVWLKAHFSHRHLPKGK
jgi:hypothetical protein